MAVSVLKLLLTLVAYCYNDFLSERVELFGSSRRRVVFCGDYFYVRAWCVWLFQKKKSTGSVLFLLLPMLAIMTEGRLQFQMLLTSA